MSATRIFRAIAAAAVMSAVAAPAMADDSGFAYMHDLRKEGGRTCFTDHYHYGSGSGPTKAAAQKAAIGSWASFTDFEYGSDWARFSRAASKGMTCSGGGGGSFDCQIEARPCK
ncbi:MAG: hypothetical protein JNN24_13770 [Hyphomicrobium zavarzinii]|jgi:hypothetical protein|uniref:hypothetical protein n=1 Tax=Hyphomicrobium TaxID=81 RepID=UPI00039C81E9|nr:MULTISPECIES: hypothetical protein [Hyphomicrobium]MBL8846831.1 hypothetical protein [Hyphomicrobium zavarzinii]WBT38094.1 hypothetical protein PE058_20945 [Hyphomicrobium sp. DMF-1]HML44925.1 hypothetical protein [Hyphomicrobium zavarzinii]